MSYLETEKNNSKVILVSGPLGSGKTTLINNLAPNFPKNTIVIVNDIGDINIDSTRINGTDTIPLSQGCVCCQDLKSFEETLQKIKKEDQKNGISRNIIIEPTGIADGKTIKETLNKAGFNVSIITMGDSLHSERRTGLEKEIEENQLKIADIIGITWKNGNLEKYIKYLNSINPNAEIIDIPEPQKSEEYFPRNENSEFFGELWEKIQNIKHQTKKNIFKIINSGNNLSFSTEEKDHNNHNNNLNTVSIKGNISENQLKNLINILGKDLIRAKGVLANGREFDFVHGNLNFGEKTEKSGFFNLITLNKFDLNILENLDENQVENYFIPKIGDFKESEKKIKLLVEQFFERMNLDKEIKHLNNELKKTEDKDKKSELQAKIIKKELNQKTLGESMKYDNPYIWIKYKIKAYKGLPDEIITIGDFEKHCHKSPTYICGKRFDFLNKYLKEKYNIDLLTNNQYEEVENFLKNNFVQNLSQNEEFMKEWLSYEYYNENGRVAKWENYKK
ncbi:hypothetical protein BLD25_03580 [Candidatus Gracilibacteria bacterium GN02-872]|nr:hypothetical protein BLD25_03580 [Candidatus Gracilibacteria bacterium GN02-872]